MNANPLINNFNGGEITPRLDSRTDLQKYYTGCIIMENMIPLPEGGAKSRPGTYFVVSAKYSSKKALVIPFQFSSSQAYCLELGNLYARFYKNSAQIVVTRSAWLTATYYTLGSLVSQSGSCYRCIVAHTSGTFATDLASLYWEACASDDYAYEIPTPYLETELFQLQMEGSADTAYIAHGNHAPMKLVRSSHASWTLSDVVFDPPPTVDSELYPAATLTPAAVTGLGVLFTASVASFINGDLDRQIIAGAGRGTIVQVISSTLVKVDITDSFANTSAIASGSWRISGQLAGTITPSKESPEGATLTLTGSTSLTETNVSAINPGVKWLASAHGTNEYYCVTLTGGDPKIVAPSAVYEDSATMTGGTCGTLAAGTYGYGDNDTLGFNTLYVRLTDSTDPDTKTSGYVSMDYTGLTTADVFRSANVGSYITINTGFVKITSYVSATVVKARIIRVLDGVTAATSWGFLKDAWTTADYPQAVGFFEQRLGWGGTASKPNTIWFSTSADYQNHEIDSNSDDAALSYTLSSGNNDRIIWIKGEDYCMVGTVGGVHKLGASSTADPLSQTNVVVKRQSSIGCRNMPSKSLNESIVFVQRGGTVVRSIQYEYTADRYIAKDLTRLASHIALGTTRALSGITSLDYQTEPFSLLWGTRTDGQLLGATYQQAENIYAWFRVATDGEIESIAVIHEDDNEDQIWISVKRTIGGADKRYIEYFKPHEIFNDIDNAFCVDSGLTWDGGASLSVSAISLASPCVISCAGHSFTAGEKVKFSNTGTWLDDHICQVYAPATGTFELKDETGTVVINSTAFDAYVSGGTVEKVAETVSGLAHLEGETVSIVADGTVHPAKDVASGSVSLDYYANKINVGLPFVCDLMPMKFEPGGANSNTRSKREKITALSVNFYQTYGAKWGPDEDNLVDVPFGTGSTPALFTGQVDTDFDADYTRGATALIRQDLPLPMTVLSISPLITVGNE